MSAFRGAGPSSPARGGRRGSRPPPARLRSSDAAGDPGRRHAAPGDRDGNGCGEIGGDALRLVEGGGRRVRPEPRGRRPRGQERERTQHCGRVSAGARGAVEQYRREREHGEAGEPPGPRQSRGSRPRPRRFRPSARRRRLRPPARASTWPRRNGIEPRGVTRPQRRHEAEAEPDDEQGDPTYLTHAAIVAALSSAWNCSAPRT